MPVATPPQPLRPLSPEESRLLDLYVDAECDFRAFRDAANLSTAEALDFLRSIPEYLEALEIQMSSAWNRFTISRKTNVIRVLEQVIAENRDNPVERRRAATAILRAIHPPRQRAPEAATFTPSPVQPERVPSTPPRERPRDPVSQAIIARADLETLRAKIAAVQTHQDEPPAPPLHHSKHRAPARVPAPAAAHSSRPQPPLATSFPSSPPSPEKTHQLPPQSVLTQPTDTSPHPPNPASPAFPSTPSAKLHALAGAVPHCRDPAA